MLKFNQYEVELELKRPMLGTNPSNPNVMDTHIIDRQRKLIADHSKINKAINKYLDAKDISVEKQEKELSALRLRIEDTIGETLTDEEFAKMREGEFKKFKDLKETMAELDEKGITCFFRDDEGKIVIGSHMILGFMKAASESIGRTMTRKKATIFQSVSYTQSIINQHVNILEDLIVASEDIVRTSEGKAEYLQRSLRAMTPLGPRISLAKSEQLPKGTKFKFTMSVLGGSPLKFDHIKDMFQYGSGKGLGQWRNSGHGQFEVLTLKEL